MNKEELALNASVEKLSELTRKLKLIQDRRYSVLNSESEEAFENIKEEFLEAGFPFDYDVDDYLDETEDESSEESSSWLDDESSEEEDDVVENDDDSSSF